MRVASKTELHEPAPNGAGYYSSMKLSKKTFSATKARHRARGLGQGFPRRAAAGDVLKMRQGRGAEARNRTKKHLGS